MTDRADQAACWGASSAAVVAGAATMTAMTTAVGTTTMTTTGVGMAAGADGGAMTTMTMTSSSSPLCKDCHQRPVVPYHERCQDCLVRIAWPKP